MAGTSSFSFLWKALLLPLKNPNLLYIVFLMYIVSHKLLSIVFQQSVAPVSSNLDKSLNLLLTIDQSSPEFMKVLNTIKTVTKEFFIVEVAFYIFQFVISSFLTIITFYANSTTYLGEILTLNELLYKVKGIIKGPLITELVVALFHFSYLNSFHVINFAIYWYASINYKANLWIFLFPLNWFNILLLSYLTMIWSMGVAISVAEPNFYGINAISHAMRLLKGKRKQFLLLVFALSSCPLAGSLNLVFRQQLLWQVVCFYSMMAITVLYYECNQGNADVRN